MYSDQQMEKFLEVAFSEVKYRNAGLVFYFTFRYPVKGWECLTWDRVNFKDKSVLVIPNQKGASSNTITVDDNDLSLLMQQKRDFHDTDFVFPMLSKHNWNKMTALIHWSCHTPKQVNVITKRIAKKAGVPHLFLSQLTRKRKD